MNVRRTKLTIFIVTGIAFAVLSSYLVANPTPAPVTTAAPTVIATPASAVAQPKITWSPTSVEVILSPGESISKDFTFSSSLPLQNAVLEAVPKIVPFLSIQPSNIANLPASQQQSVRLNFAITAGATLGTYDGT